MGKPVLIPHVVDIHVGAKIRLRRKELAVSQQALAEQVGVSFQQIQKYEKGANRVSASVLVTIAAALDATPGYFLNDAPGASDAAVTNDDWSRARQLLVITPGGVEGLTYLAAMPSALRTDMLTVMRAAAHQAPMRAVA